MFQEDGVLLFPHEIGRLETFEIYELAATLGEHRYASRSKIAILTLPDTPLDPSEFLETCSRNRGVNMEAFTNYEDTIHWLFPTEFHDMKDAVQGHNLHITANE